MCGARQWLQVETARLEAADERKAELLRHHLAEIRLSTEGAEKHGRKP
jgi:hypothetical protein